MASKRTGRPLKFTTLEDLQKKIDAYFESCFEEKWFDEEEKDDNGEKVMIEGGDGRLVPKIKHTKKKVMIQTPTITGLAIALDTSRDTLLDYQEMSEFSDTIKKAKDFVHHFTEQRFADGKVHPTAGIFILKNNWNWEDKVKTEHSGEINNPYEHLTDEQINAKLKEHLDGERQEKGEDRPSVLDGKNTELPENGSGAQGSGTVPEKTATEPKGGNTSAEKPLEDNGNNDSVHNSMPA